MRHAVPQWGCAASDVSRRVANVIHTTSSAAADHFALRLSAHLSTLLSTAHTPEAADLARTVSANPRNIGLDTLERVSGLLHVHPADLIRSAT